VCVVTSNPSLIMFVIKRLISAMKVMLLSIVLSCIISMVLVKLGDGKVYNCLMHMDDVEVSTDPVFIRAALTNMRECVLKQRYFFDIQLGLLVVILSLTVIDLLIWAALIYIKKLQSEKVRKYAAVNAPTNVKKNTHRKRKNNAGIRRDVVVAVSKRTVSTTPEETVPEPVYSVSPTSPTVVHAVSPSSRTAVHPTPALNVPNSCPASIS